ncbi:hypothetical protein [Amycolatopsis plumensis]|uniref:Uncharacterized protein n=1 Tax=Amycolatopsis plumensis TaxID=236508 RepID=A0ABV5TZJ9_9PSEU
MTIVSAICLINDSLMLQPNVFHEFHPIGGVRATPLSNASADDVCSTVVIADSSTPAANSVAARRGRGSRVAVTLISLLGAYDVPVAIRAAARPGTARPVVPELRVRRIRRRGCDAATSLSGAGFGGVSVALNVHAHKSAYVINLCGNPDEPQFGAEPSFGTETVVE